jgi:predicted amidohydrolase
MGQNINSGIPISRSERNENMKLAMAQMGMSENTGENLQKSLGLVRQAAESGADLVLFPEVQLNRFFAQYPGRDVSALGVTPDGPEVTALWEVCRTNHIWAAPNVYLLENGKYFDTTLLIDRQGEIAGMQKMVHIAQAKQFYEQDYYTPSDDGFKVFDTEFGKIGIVICFDRHYPESVRTEALMGADLILIPTANVKAEPSETFEWEIRIQAFQNSVAIAMCNRVGREDAMDFSGESLVAGPNGEKLVKADDREQIVYCELDPKTSRAVRAGKPYTSLRRKEMYL